MKKLGVLILIFILPLHVSFTQPNEKNNIIISLLTCAPGDALYSIYGHNAIRINNPNSDIDLVYNYGTFDFNTPGFALKFMRGKLPYLLSVSSYNDFLREYQYFERDVNEQILNMDSIQKQNIIQYLSINMLPENKAYKYDFFKDNCATRLRDIVVLNTNSLIWDESQSSGKTFRQIIKEYQRNMPWTNFGIDLIIGSPADKITTLQEEAFIPDYLSNNIQNATQGGQYKKKLSGDKINVFKFNKKLVNNNPLFSPWLFFIILLLIEINLLLRFMAGKNLGWVTKYDIIWGVIISLSCLLMLFMWFATDHIPTKYNYNLLWCNPLLVVVWWFRSRLDKVVLKKLLIILSGFLLLCFVNALPGFNFLPQYFHPIIMIVSSILFLKIYRWLKVAKN